MEVVAEEGGKGRRATHRPPKQQLQVKAKCAGARWPGVSPPGCPHGVHSEVTQFVDCILHNFWARPISTPNLM